MTPDKATALREAAEAVFSEICLIDACGQVCVDGDSIERGVRKALEPLLAERERLRAALEWLNRKGGLGLDVHKHIHETLWPDLVWQDISTAPKDGSEVDLLYPEGDLSPSRGASWKDGIGWCRQTISDDGETYFSTYPNTNPTHWRKSTRETDHDLR